MHLNSQILTSAGFSVMLGLMALLAVAAFLSLRRMDDVLLKSRIYLNRRKLFWGFLAVALSMVTILALVLVGLSYIVIAHDEMPSAFGIGGFLLSFGFLAWGIYNFYALARTPRAVAREAA